MNQKIQDAAQELENLILSNNADVLIICAKEKKGRVKGDVRFNMEDPLNLADIVFTISKQHPPVCQFIDYLVSMRQQELITAPLN